MLTFPQLTATRFSVIIWIEVVQSSVHLHELPLGKDGEIFIINAIDSLSQQVVFNYNSIIQVEQTIAVHISKNTRIAINTNFPLYNCADIHRNAIAISLKHFTTRYVGKQCSSTGRRVQGNLGLTSRRRKRNFRSCVVLRFVNQGPHIDCQFSDDCLICDDLKRDNCYFNRSTFNSGLCVRNKN